MRGPSLVLISVILIDVLSAGTNQPESTTQFKTGDRVLSVISPSGSFDPYSLPLERPITRMPEKPTQLRGNVYLWWVERIPEGVEIAHSYTPLPHVRLEVYDILGSLIEERILSPESDGQYAFEFSVHVVTPIVLIFDADATFPASTGRGEAVSDTFMPTVTWVASRGSSEPIYLEIAIPTVGQLAILGEGSTVLIKSQLNLIQSVVEKNEAASIRWAKRVRSVRDISQEIRTAEDWRWGLLQDGICAHCRSVIEVPEGDLLDNIRLPWRGKEILLDIDGFAVGAREIARSDFRRFVEDTNYEVSPGCAVHRGTKYLYDPRLHSQLTWLNPGYSQSDDDPVVCVSWDDSQVYVDWLSKNTGYPYRLLSVAEMHYMIVRMEQDGQDGGVGQDSSRLSGFDLGVKWTWFVQDCVLPDGTPPGDGSPMVSADGGVCQERLARSLVRNEDGEIGRHSIWPDIGGDHIGFFIARDRLP